MFPLRSSFTLWQEGRAWAGEDLAECLRTREAALRAGGVVPGTITPLLADLSAAGVVNLLAHWSARTVPALLNPLLPPPELARALDAPIRPGASGSEAAAGPGRSVAILRTSGSTGVPCTVTLSKDNVVASIEGAASRLGLGAADTWLASLSTAHVGGLLTVARALLLGCRLVTVADGRVPPVRAIGDAIRGQADSPPVSHVSLVPTQLARLLEFWGGRPPPPSLRCVLVGGAATPPDLLAACLRARWPIALTYGMTETTSQIATATPGQVRHKPGSVGKVLGVGELARTADGELKFRGPTLAVPPDPDGWYHTGDYGYFDGDGDLWITGRRSERIVSGGVTVGASEVEGVLRLHPAVADACVVGVPDEHWGELVAACVVGVEGEFNLDQLQAWTRTQLAPSHRPRCWLLAAGLPRNPNGKLDRSRVARWMVASHAHVAPPAAHR